MNNDGHFEPKPPPSLPRLPWIAGPDSEYHLLARRQAGRGGPQRGRFCRDFRSEVFPVDRGMGLQRLVLHLASTQTDDFCLESHDKVNSKYELLFVDLKLNYCGCSRENGQQQQKITSTNQRLSSQPF